MAYTLTSVELIVQATIVQTETLTTGLSSTPTIVRPGTTRTAWAYGTGASQASKAWSNKISLAGSAQTLDLTALSGGYGASSFSNVKGILIENLATNTAHVLTVGNAASNVWKINMSAATTTFTVDPECGELKWSKKADGWVVDSSNKNLKLDPGANTFDVVITIWGE